MEAKDTVIKRKEYHLSIKLLLKEQAEISFKAGMQQEASNRRKAAVSLAELCLKHRKAGIKEVVDYFSRHWMGATKGMLIYEIPEKDRDLLENGEIPKEWGVK